MASFLLVLRWILQESGDFTWRVSDCEEFVGVTYRRLWGQAEKFSINYFI